MKIRPVGTELFHADGETGMKELTVDFRNFANSPKNGVTPYTVHRRTYTIQNWSSLRPWNRVPLKT
jgi:hypothetical protein